LFTRTIIMDARVKPAHDGGVSRRSVGFFKRAAKARRVPYQRIIRALVDAYAEKQAGK
jgi:hypothetical protein